MIHLKINGKLFKAPEDKTILEVAREAGYTIPTMCHLDGHDHFPSCMICVVRDVNTGKMMPSCTTKVTESMDIVTDDVEVRDARKMGLELLLSDHIGDCEAPCQTNCPAYMDPGDEQVTGLRAN